MCGRRYGATVCSTCTDYRLPYRPYASDQLVLRMVLIRMRSILAENQLIRIFPFSVPRNHFYGCSETNRNGRRLCGNKREKWCLLQGKQLIKLHNCSLYISNYVSACMCLENRFVMRYAAARLSSAGFTTTFVLKYCFDMSKYQYRAVIVLILNLTHRYSKRQMPYSDGDKREEVFKTCVKSGLRICGCCL